MAKIVTITNPLTGQPAQVDQLDHTAQQIDDGLNIARGVSNPNLLDNWYFGNPVNQRNVSGAIDAVGYFLDRWKLVSGSVTIGSNGITLNGTIAQILETAVGTDVTASAMTTEGVVVASYDNNSKTFSLTGTGQTFVAAKLELGSQQTLAHQENGVWVLNEIPNYGEQLARCQRNSCILFDLSNYGRAGLVVAEGSDIAHLYISTPVTMRAIPSIQFLHGSISDLYLARNGSYTPISGVSCSNNCAGYLDILLNTSGLTEGNVYTVRVKENRVCILSISEL